MQRCIAKGFILFFAVLLTGCVYHQRGMNPNMDLTHETWQQQVAVNPNKWAVGADRWFLAGGENATEAMVRHAPVSAAVSTMMVKVPNSFTHIKVSGHFQVQVFGSSDANSVYVYGPNSAVRAVAVRVTNNTLYLNEVKDAPQNVGNVIVRVGIRNLRLLSQMGPGLIEGRLINSGGLCVLSMGSGNVYLSGRINLKRVMTRCKGNITVFGAVTPELYIATFGSGSVNVSGKVGVSDILHHGTGDVNIIGANSDRLQIRADGKGKIGIQGQVAICSIEARDCVSVYAYQVDGDSLTVRATDNARVGLAGCVRNLMVDTRKKALFGGRYLYTADTFVRAHDQSHANVTGGNRVFASATENGSIYFFGSPAVLDSFTRDYGTVTPIEDTSCQRQGSYCPYFKSMKKYKD